MTTPQNSWDQRVFNATIPRYLELISLTIPQAINKKAYDLAIVAGGETKKVSKETIEDELGPVASRIVAQKFRITKKSGVKRGKLVSEKVFQRLTYALAAKALGSGFTHEELQDKAAQIYGARKASIAFIKQGWIPAKEILKRSDRGGDQPAMIFTESQEQRLGRFGAYIKQSGADAANRGFHPVARLWNSTTDSPRSGPGALAAGNEGLQKAFDRVTADMLVYIDRKIGRPTARFNAAQRR